MNDVLIAKLEGLLGFMLPLDYRQFLLSNTQPLLESDLIFRPPRTGIISELLTIEQILENSDDDRIGIPDKSLLHIGGNLMGGHLYLEVGRIGFGRVHYIENDKDENVFGSFAEFLEQSMASGIAE